MFKEERPWGYYKVLNETKNHKTKYIQVNPNQKLSYQRHKHRSEHWFIVSGNPIITIDGKQTVLYPGESVDIGVMSLHRIQAQSSPVEFIEVQTGTSFDESDIERLEDDYGRSNS